MKGAAYSSGITIDSAGKLGPVRLSSEQAFTNEYQYPKKNTLQISVYSCYTTLQKFKPHIHHGFHFISGFGKIACSNLRHSMHIFVEN